MKAIEELVQFSDSLRQASALLADEDVDENSSSSSRMSSTFLNVAAFSNVPTGENGATWAPISIDLQKDGALSNKSIILQIDNKSQQVSASALPAPLPASVLRLWRPAAQRNLRNQWSKMTSYRQQWVSASSSGRSHATSLINSSLSQRYMPLMELGVLSDMPDIRNKACFKLFKQQEHRRSKLLSSYKDMVAVVNYMFNISRSMRCFLKGPNSSPLVQFSSYSEDVNDTGDGGGIPVFVFLSIAAFEKLSEELVQMFQLELNLKRLLVVELLSTTCETPSVNEFCWSDELYPGEFDDLSMCNLYSKETCEPVTPRSRDCNSAMPTQAGQYHSQPNQEILQVYLTTWLAEVNIDTHRVNEIFTIIEEEMHLKIS